MQKIQVSASILSADMCNLEAVVRTLETSGTDMLHFDVMDGRFVDNISFGIPVLEAIRKKTDLFLDVHLMISDPLRTRHYAPRRILCSRFLPCILLGISFSYGFAPIFLSIVVLRKMLFFNLPADGRSPRLFSSFPAGISSCQLPSYLLRLSLPLEQFPHLRRHLPEY